MTLSDHNVKRKKKKKKTMLLLHFFKTEKIQLSVWYEYVCLKRKKKSVLSVIKTSCEDPMVFKIITIISFKIVT